MVKPLQWVGQFIILCSLGIGIAQAHADGTDHSGGGSFTPAEFMDFTREYLRFLKAGQPSIMVHLEFADTDVKLEYGKFKAIYDAGITVTNDDAGALFVNGNRVDLVNIPDKNQVKANDAKWAQEQSGLIKLQLTIHELLGLAAIPDANFELSETLKNLVATFSDQSEAAKGAGDLAAPAPVNAQETSGCYCKIHDGADYLLYQPNGGAHLVLVTQDGSGQVSEQVLVKFDICWPGKNLVEEQAAGRLEDCGQQALNGCEAERKKYPRCQK